MTMEQQMQMPLQTPDGQANVAQKLELKERVGIVEAILFVTGNAVLMLRR